MKLNLWTLLYVFLVVYFLFQIRDDLLKTQEFKGEKEKLAAGLVEEDKKQAACQIALSQLKNSQRIETLARERLNLIKKGEAAFKICR